MNICTLDADARCLVDDPDNRADTQELLLHPFCTHDVSRQPTHLQCSNVMTSADGGRGVRYACLEESHFVDRFSAA